MSPLDKLIFISDKIEPTRGFDSSDLISAMMNDAEKGFVVVLQANKKFLSTKEKSTNNPLTSKCFNYYLE